MLPSCSTLQRQALILSGEKEWCKLQSEVITRQYSALDVCIPAEAKPNLLGQELDILIVNAWQGFDPDYFGQATGAIRGGGLLVLLTPELDAWPEFDDPQSERLNVALYPASGIQGRFIKHLVKIIRSDTKVIVIREGDPLPDLNILNTANDKSQSAITSTLDQQQAIEAIIKVVTGQRRRPVVLTSDRGRGKSAAFGFAAAELMKQGNDNIIVTGPSIQATNALFKHAGQQLVGAHSKRGLLTWNAASIKFIPPDDLVDGQYETDLLLVDEAAAIPTPILQALLARFPRIAFATTVHGYEGTGRGFAVRFHQILDTQTRGWKAVSLETPIRWAANDPVEHLVSKMLLLDAEAAPDVAIEDAKPGLCQIEKLERDKLINDETLLSELFGLLVLAHYRTRPFDLRHLLDGQNVSVYVTRYKGHIVAVALVSEEGGFNAEISGQIRLGNARPHGHLLPEILAAHLGLDQAPQLKCARVMRIAVHPCVRQHGLGAALLKAVIDDAIKRNLDYVGSSFGATLDLLRFWCQSDFIPVRLSIKRGATSGEHSAVLLQGLNKSGNELVNYARNRFEKHIFHQLSDPLRDIDPDIAMQLLLTSRPHQASQLDEADRQDLSDFATGNRLYETCMGPVHQLVKDSVLQNNAISHLTEQENKLLIVRVLQGRDWQAASLVAGLEGRKQAIDLLRKIVAKLMNNR
jgi:tRNA(Met) cytidine acetyltransferase